MAIIQPSQVCKGYINIMIAQIVDKSNEVRIRVSQMVDMFQYRYVAFKYILWLLYMHGLVYSGNYNNDG